MGRAEIDVSLCASTRPGPADCFLLGTEGKPPGGRGVPCYVDQVAANQGIFFEDNTTAIVADGSDALSRRWPSGTSARAWSD